MMFNHFGFGWVGMIVGLVINLALIIGFVWLVVWAVRKMSGSRSASNQAAPAVQSPKDFAKMRYAKGEITQEEYHKLLADLEK